MRCSDSLNVWKCYRTLDEVSCGSVMGGMMSMRREANKGNRFLKYPTCSSLEQSLSTRPPQEAGTMDLSLALLHMRQGRGVIVPLHGSGSGSG